MQLECQEVRNDALERVLVRLVRLERAAGVVEKPKASRPDRRRPFEGDAARRGDPCALEPAGRGALGRPRRRLIGWPTRRQDFSPMAVMPDAPAITHAAPEMVLRRLEDGSVLLPSLRLLS